MKTLFGLSFVAAMFVSTSAFGGIVASYSFNDGTADDQSGNANHATVFGSTLTTDRFGNAGQAMFFDGAGDYVQTPVDSNGTPRSFSVWFQSLSSAGERSIVDSDVSGAFGHSLIIDYALGAPSTGNLDVQFHNGASDTGSDGAVATGLWHHAVVNFGSDIEVYLDNVLVHTETYTPPAFDGSDFRLGRHNAGDPQFFHGSIDDVNFYDMVLTADDVDDLFNAANPVVPEPTSMALFAFGAAGFGFVARRRRQQTA